MARGVDEQLGALRFNFAPVGGFKRSFPMLLRQQRLISAAQLGKVVKLFGVSP
jgi:hypothetical protein